jgi:hypothetical protein
MSDQNTTLISDALKKRIYRGKSKDQLGDKAKKRST